MSRSRFDFAAEVPALEALGRVHFIAIGGAGMSAVARLMLAAGVPVSGSDAKDSAALRALEEAGATVFVGQRAEQVEGADTVVVSSAIGEDNVELVAARDAGLRVLHRAQGLAALRHGHQVVAVAGANGKTTTTSMLVVALRAVGADPAFASGAEIPQEGTNAALGAGPQLVVEADESDGSFVVYRPDVAIVTNVQPDHLDFHGDLAGVEAAYRSFVDSMAADGLLVACADDPGARSLGAYARSSGRRVLTYGSTPQADHRLIELSTTENGAKAVLLVEGVAHELALAVPGEHNLENAAAAFGALTAGCGLSAAEALAGLRRFTGAARRFESHGEYGGVRVIDDYAHNPPKVTAAVRTGAELARQRSGRLIAVFQPHLYSRTRDFAQQFAQALAPADEIVLLDIYGAREQPMEGVSSDLIAGPLQSAGRSVHRPRDVDVALEATRRLARPGDVVMTIGAGDVTELAARIAQSLQHEEEATP